MITKGTFAHPAAVWQPDLEGNAAGKKLAGPCELSSIKLVSGSSAAVVSLYNGSVLTDAIPGNLKWVMDSSTTYDDQQTFTNPLNFEKGIFAVLEQGSNASSKLCYSVIPGALAR